MSENSAASQSAPIEWRRVLSLSDADDPVLSRLRGHQLVGFLQQLGWIVMVLVSAAVSLAAMLAPTPLADLGYGWVGFLCLLYGGMFLMAWRAQQRPRPHDAGAIVRGRRLREIAALVLVAAVAFNSLPIYLALNAPASVHIFAVAAVQLATISVCAFLLASAPLAALAFLAVSAVALTLSAVTIWFEPGGPGALVLGFFLTLVVLRGVLAQATTLARHVRHLENLRARGEVIGLLLHEFEQNSLDWLWEVDDQNRLTHASARFTQVTGIPLESMLGRNMMAPEVPDIDVQPHPDIQAAFIARRTFRNAIVELTVQGEQRWWSVSGSPRFDSSGRFLGYIGVTSDVTEMRRHKDQIERMANCDGLTGLANRSVMRGRLQASLDAAKRSGGTCAVLLLDLDRFKAVNDSLGHPIGDELLREVGRRLSEAVPQDACCARLGGDEFAVVVPSRSGLRARTLGEQLIARISEPYVIRSAHLKIGASVGVAEGPRDGDTIDAMIRAADLALYRAKEDGRGIARLYEPLLHSQAEERRQLEVALRSALKEDQLSLMFQPIYSLSTNEVRGFEALLRWTHPMLGAIPPSRFIPVAEDIGVIDSIGEWVIRTACAWAARWPEHIGVAVNLSPSQLVNPRLPAVVLHALAAHGVAPDRLELEITENVFLNENDVTRAALAQLVSLGVRIGLDDFGTGYSSLGYLRNSVFSTIKIDRLFVRDAVDAESQSAEIVRHIVSLANNLGMETVAEGAETGEELDAVRSLGCGNVQGYYTGRPMPPEDATALVGNRSAARAA